MNKRLLFLTLRNTLLGIGLIFGFFAFGFIILFLNTYLGTAVFSIAFVSICALIFIISMSHSAAQDQIERERRRSNEVMNKLKKEYI